MAFKLYDTVLVVFAVMHTYINVFVLLHE